MTQGETQATDPLVGAVVAGRYTIIKQLGEGGMGCVYLAEQQLGSAVRKVALKTLHKHLSHDAHIKARFHREAGTVAALEHPNTIQVHDFGEMPDGTLYLVMEFVQGRSVADILEKDGPMPPARVENILRQVCGSLEEAHSHGIVHRDLKPDNIILCERAGQRDWVEVLDFGIAKRSSEHDPNEAKLTQQGMVLGTPPYMSPEQFTGQPVDLRSDIYALGVMAYEMLVGKYPFEANTAWEWASKHMTEPPRPIETQPLGSHVPERMRNAIARALAKDKEARFSSAQEFFSALSATGPSAASLGAAPSADVAPSASSGAAAVAPREERERAKTEIGEPLAFGGPYAPPPVAAYAPAPAAAPYSPGSPSTPLGVAVPPAPAAVSHKKSNSGLVVGLGALAVVLLGGGVAAYATRSKSPSPPPALDLGAASTSPQGSGASSPSPPVDGVNGVVPAEPLGGVAAPLPVGVQAPAKAGHNAAAGSSAAAPGKTAIPTPIPTPTTAPTPAPAPSNPAPSPTPTTQTPVPTPAPKAEPPICALARSAKKRGSPAAAGLEAQCRAAGGTP